MSGQSDVDFIQLINSNLGIAHKISRIYFKDNDEQNDAIQEMMYQLWKSYPGFDGSSKFSTWMYRVCLNTALTHRRNENRRRSESLSDMHRQIPDEPVSTKEEDIRMLFDAIAILSPINKAIVLLYLEDLSYEEIASITGISKSNVSVRLVRIKKELESQIKKVKP